MTSTWHEARSQGHQVAGSAIVRDDPALVVARLIELELAVHGEQVLR